MAHKLLSTTMIISIKCNSLALRRCMSSSSATGLNVGFIGLGQMGNRMATNLLKKVRLYTSVREYGEKHGGNECTKKRGLSNEQFCVIRAGLLISLI